MDKVNHSQADLKEAEKPHCTFRKTKSGKWAVMGPVELLKKAVGSDGTVDVRKRSGDWTTYTVVSLGKPFDVDGRQMCYGYDSVEEQSSADSQSLPEEGSPSVDLAGAPSMDLSEPLPEFKGDAMDEAPAHGLD